MEHLPDAPVRPTAPRKLVETDPFRGAAFELLNQWDTLSRKKITDMSQRLGFNVTPIADPYGDEPQAFWTPEEDVLPVLRFIVSNPEIRSVSEAKRAMWLHGETQQHEAIGKALRL